MKKLFKTFALIALTAATSLTASASDHEYKNTLENESSFQVGMYSNSQEQVRLLMDKTKGTAITVELRTENGSLLHKEVVNKKSTSYNRYFDMSSLADGSYTFVIKNGSEVVTKEITKKSEVIQEITIN